jgi:uncharacterized ParB-like nuclease family protein
MSEMKVTMIPTARVQSDDRLRRLNEKQVTRLVDSIREIGLLHPITVWQKPGAEENIVEPDYGIVAGAHRLEACKRLGHTEIAAIVVDLSDLKRQLAEVDENLAGSTLTKAERALFTKHRKDIYEALHPETRHGAIGGGHDQSRKLCDSAKAERFTGDTAAHTSRSERAVQLDAARGENIAEGVLEVIMGTDFDFGTNLDALAKLHVEQQQAVAEYVRNGDLISAKVLISPPADQTGNGTPANDAKSIDKQMAALKTAWSKACPEARDGFLKQIDWPAFDNIGPGRTGQTSADLSINPGDVRLLSPVMSYQSVADDGVVHHQPDE